MLSLLKGHEEHLTTISSWNNYCKSTGLPHSQTLISHFGSWNNLKHLLGLEVNKQSRPKKYSDEYLYNILRKYKNHYTSAKNWDDFSVKNNLPSHKIIMDRIGPYNAYKKTGVIPSWTEEIIREVILKEFPEIPPTVSEWNQLKSEDPLPSSRTIIRRFESWEKMKRELY